MSTSFENGDGNQDAPSLPAPSRLGAGAHPWTFLTNHGHVLIVVAADPTALVHDIATRVGISGRATLHILKDLEDAGYLQRIKEGRRTRYVINAHQHFRHPSLAHQEIDALLSIFGPAPDAPRKDNS
ncbi:helix-turn-helix transcriptional regulator [Arthrobacter sp. TMS2-4]